MMGMREKILNLLIVAKDLITLSRQADFLIANDVIQVVRCKECKHFDKLFKAKWATNNIGTCRLREDEDLQPAVSCDDFCSYGERKDNG